MCDLINLKRERLYGVNRVAKLYQDKFRQLI